VKEMGSDGRQKSVRETHERKRARAREMGKCNKHPPGIRTVLKVHDRGSPNEEASRLFRETRRFSERA
jgi:hypothetical protein